MPVVLHGLMTAAGPVHVIVVVVNSMAQLQPPSLSWRHAVLAVDHGAQATPTSPSAAPCVVQAVDPLVVTT
jgi:hypothetical protein